MNEQKPLQRWYQDIINKHDEELSLFDLSRMLRQKVLLQTAVPFVIDVLDKNPFEGEWEAGSCSMSVSGCCKGTISGSEILFRASSFNRCFQ
ncbi:contact-dependent growth inhibition system immunity protein [Butyrivibrio sp. INlla16]|uniref:contact-dependent growth inhibition system immunity protein n=1 Tax=Butyrivibrio sp. INlla16 TaxID=1520807 RepID=UPI00147C5D22